MSHDDDDSTAPNIERPGFSGRLRDRALAMASGLVHNAHAIAITTIVTRVVIGDHATAAAAVMLILRVVVPQRRRQPPPRSPARRP